MTTDVQVSVGQLLLALPLPASTLERLSLTGPRGLALLLGMHPLRTPAMFAAAYRAHLPLEVRVALVAKAPLSAQDVTTVLSREAGAQVLSELLFVTTGDLDARALRALATAAGAEPEVVAACASDQLGRLCAIRLEVLDLWETLGERRRDLVHANHQHDLWRLSHPGSKARAASWTSTSNPPVGRVAGQRPPLSADVPVLELADELLPLAAHWLHACVGDDPAAWQVICSFAGPGATLRDLADVALAVTVPATRPRAHLDAASAGGVSSRGALWAALRRIRVG